MNRVIFTLISIIFLFTTLYSNDVGKNQHQPKQLDPTIEEMVASVNEEEAEALLRILVYDFGSRNAKHSGNVKACEWARDKFIEWGLDSVYLESFSSSYGPNVIAIKKGTKEVQDSIIITSGHIDGMPSGNISPAADDNGSGTINTMYTAKAMSNYKFRNDVRYILWNAEDYGLVGSKAYVKDHKNDKIAAVFVHDMSLWFKQGDTDIDIEVKSQYKWLADFFETAGEDYTDLEIKSIDPST